MLKVNTHSSNLIGASKTREAMLTKHLIDTTQAVVWYSRETHFQVRVWKHFSDIKKINEKGKKAIKMNDKPSFTNLYSTEWLFPSFSWGELTSLVKTGTACVPHFFPFVS